MAFPCPHPCTLAKGWRRTQSLKTSSATPPRTTPPPPRRQRKQFESLFMREMIKSMREATMKSGLLDSAQGDLGTDMLDQQLSVQMSGQPGGLSEIIARQLAQAMGVEPAAASHATTLSPEPAGGPGNAPTAGPITTTPPPPGATPSSST
jgi:flagellar protein FlgJ